MASDNKSIAAIHITADSSDSRWYRHAAKRQVPGECPQISACGCARPVPHPRTAWLATYRCCSVQRLKAVASSDVVLSTGCSAHMTHLSAIRCVHVSGVYMLPFGFSLHGVSRRLQGWQAMVILGLPVFHLFNFSTHTCFAFWQVRPSACINESLLVSGLSTCFACLFASVATCLELLLCRKHKG